MARLMAAGGEPRVAPLQQHIAGGLGRLLLITLGAVGFVLLLACANVTGLLLARTTGRERELAMRAAIGATPRRLAQWLLAESFILAALGGAAALLALVWSMSGLREFLANTAPHPDTIVIDPSVLGFAAVATLLTGLLCSLFPIARGHNLAFGLKLSAPGTTRAAVRDSVRRLLVVGQVAVASVLLVGALLLTNSLWRLTGVALGFHPANVLTLRLSTTGLRNRHDYHAAELKQILDRIRALPGVVSAGSGTAFPLAGHDFGFVVAIEGEPAPPADAPNTAVDLVSPGYFRTMGIRLDAGRDFGERDGGGAPAVAIINQTFARANFGRRDPLGSRLSLGGQPRDANITVVGVVSDVRDGNPGDDVRPTVYRPFAQAAPQIGWHTAAIAVHTSSDPMRLSETVRKTISALAPASAVYDFAAMQDRVDASVAPQRQRAALFGLFAVAAVLLTAVGLYGLLAYMVAQDMHEFGVRLALGSTPAQLLAVVMRRGVWPACAGVVLGLAGALALTRLLAGLLYGVTATDPLTYLAAALTMLLVSVVASCLPARRAMNADPMTILRSE
jgi:putative ABC transport system permease protein